LLTQRNCEEVLHPTARPLHPCWAGRRSQTPGRASLKTADRLGRVVEWAFRSYHGSGRTRNKSIRRTPPKKVIAEKIVLAAKIEPENRAS
ncbi:MAG TPA: hypothetical protein VG122_05620, partial [Gemmata sp.]|nr:hypothetical protein [Gemmata sp.]